MKKVLLLFCLLLTLRLWDGTVTLYSKSWLCNIIPAGVGNINSGIVFLHGSSGRDSDMSSNQYFYIRDVQLLRDGEDLIILNGKFVSKSPGRWLIEGE
jgi:hypothetical protein